MEEVINKSDDQFKDMLDEIVDFSKHESKKDPLIKELNRSKIQQQKPSASLNSSTYSSAASSLSTSAASSSSTSSDSSTSSSASISSSTSSSPKQSIESQKAVDKKEQLTSQDGYSNVEVARMQELGKQAKILEHIFLSPSFYNDRFSSNFNNSTAANHSSSSNSINHDRTLDQTSNRQYALSELNVPHSASGANQPTNSWTTINGKRDKRRRKPIEKKVLAEKIPGNIGDRSVEELEHFIKSGKNTPMKQKNNNKNHRFNNISNGPGFNNQFKPNSNINQTKKSVNNSNPNSTIRSRSSKMTSSQHQNHQFNSSHQNQEQQQSAKSEQPNANPQNIHESSAKSNTILQPTRNTLPAANNQNNDPQNLKENSKKVISQNTKTIARDNSYIRSCQQNRQSHSPGYQSQQQAQKDQPDVVTFANHLHFKEKDDVSKIKFGFFSETVGTQVSITTPAICSQEAIKVDMSKISMPNNSNSKSTSAKRQTNLRNLQTTRESKQKTKQFKTSRNSEEYILKSKQEASSFNYEQILKYISNAWQNAQQEDVGARNR